MCDLDGRSHEIQADHSGIIDVVIDVDLEPGWHRIGLSSENSQVATALVFIVDPQTRFGVVSDIDDTVMVTALPRPLLGRMAHLRRQRTCSGDHAGHASPVRATQHPLRRLAVHLLVNGRLERRANLDSLSVAKPLSRRCAAAHRLGTYS